MSADTMFALNRIPYISFILAIAAIAMTSAAANVVADDVADASTACCEGSTYSALPVIFFATDSADIGPAESRKLDELIKTLGVYSDIKLLVLGHTDSRGSVAYNQALSKRRAESVVSYLVDRGVAGNRLSSDALSESRPMVSNVSETGRAENRRVVFVER